MRIDEYFQTPKEHFYRDINYTGTEEEYIEAIKTSRTLYVGDLSFNITEERLWELFTHCGEIRRIIMGINKNSLQPCGFAFVEFYDKTDCAQAQQYMNGIRLDQKYIKCDVDYGFAAGRQYGRGKFGGQFKEDTKRQKKMQLREKRWINK